MSVAGGFWIVGCGHMGGAMLAGWIASGMDPREFLVVDPAAPNVPVGVVVTPEAPDGPIPRSVLFGIKPQMLDAVAPGIAPALGADTRLYSMLAGVEIAALRARFPKAGEIVRVMPNLPAALGKGVLALYGETADREGVTALMAPLGLAEWIAEEALFDAVTALSGSGPAFVYRFIDALASAGAALGLPADQALRFATATVGGAAAIAGSDDAPPAALAARVTSKGGTTAAGLSVLDRDDALARLVAATLAAAAARSRELAEAAKPV